MELQQVNVGHKSLADYATIVSRGLMEQLKALAEPLAGKRVLHLSATAFGGGVAEILYTLVPLMRDAGLDTEWRVIYGQDEFFDVTKAIHNALQGAPRSLSDEERGIFRRYNLGNAEALARLDGNQFDTAVIVGPSHVDAFAFTSVYDGDAYATPLGVLEVDRELAARLSRAHTSIRASVRGHTLPRGARGERGEHGIEVLLPFLQRRHAGIRIVPVVMGTQDWDASHALGRAIAECADAHRTLVVASSDLSHFHSYADAVARDTAFCETLTHLNPSELHEAVRSGRCEACGAGPVVASLIATEVWCERQCRILERINSGDVTGDHESVVGYAAAVVTSP